MKARLKSKSKRCLALVLAGTAMLSGLWLIAFLASSRPLAESLLLVLVQTFLSFWALLTFFRALPKAQSASGPGFLSILSLHVLLYYGIANVLPALLPELRPEITALMVTYRIPASPAEAYVMATVAALLFFVGATLGSTLAIKCLPLPSAKAHTRKRPRRYAWLPGYGLAAAACVALLVLVWLGTAQYGLRFSLLLTDEEVANFSLDQQLLFHGLLWFLPVAPVLAAAAYVQGETPRQRQLARWLLVLASLFVLVALSVWRTRSTAMLAILMPVGLLAYAGGINWRRAILPGVGLVVLIYGAITVVRTSGLEELVGASGQSGLRVGEALAAVGTRGEGQTVLGRTLADASYRTAGLEAVAALIQAQAQGWLEPQWGRVIGAGLLQALPSSLRPAFEMPERVKTAPSYYGIFETGDWVTTVVAEFVLDFGPILLFFPAILAGLALAVLDRLLLRLGRHPALDGLLILRIPYLLFMIANGGSVADMTLLFFKATVGYTALLLLVGFLTSVRFRPGRSRIGQAEAVEC